VLFTLERGEAPSTPLSSPAGGYKVLCWDKGMGMWRDEEGGGSVCALIECTPKWVQNDWSQDPERAVDVLVWGEGTCSAASVQQTLAYVMRIIQKAGDIVINGSLRSCEENAREEEEGHSLDSPYAPTMPRIPWLEVTSLRPGCALHTLSLTPSDRDCGEYSEELDSPEPLSSPVLVSCHHPQPRLTKQHLVSGYVLADSPGSGKGVLRSVRGTLTHLVADQKTPGTSTSTSTSTSSSTNSSMEKAAHTYEHPFVEFQFDATMASE
jgi:hypothetical protein